ncbi:putative ABC transport system permease protein [Litoreibacter ascidiaceicola]|uniref:Putative ABC transport system permease protein n=1 Tax=Litoreibacter ascidiaceicola TaxID=1486859 RepID=A0A1M4XDA7_9RHOB|nr:FtsX-like permease family protein [Litoreibacter ascidiaceicola]SHE91222.1 putative ABC transport system permease protein [Litoreibacter ascidiaceicola]
MSLAWRIARRELRGGLRGFWVFLACLALGVAAIAAIGTVRGAIEAGLTEQGAVILGGDAEVQLTYRFAEPEERAFFESLGDVSELVDFRSMLATGEERALTQVKGVDDMYPLYGAVQLTPDMPLAEALAGRDGFAGAAVDPVLLSRLGLDVGDRVKLGVKEFIVMAALERMPDSAGAGFSLGPPTLVASAALQDAGLLTPGTLFETEYRIRTPEALDLEAAKAQAEAALEGTGFRWRDRRNGAPGISRFVERLSAFLVLVGLTGLAVGGVGVSAAVRAYLAGKTEVIATLRSLGASGGLVFRVYLLQVGVLAVLGIAMGLVLGGLLPLAFGPLIEASLPVPVDLALRLRPLAEAALYGALAAALFTLWPLGQSEHIRAAALFRDAQSGVKGWPRPVWIVVCGLILAALVGSAALLSGLVMLTLWAAGGIMAAFVLLVLAAMGVRVLARWLARRLRGFKTLRFALGAVGGPGREAQAVVVSLGLGLSVLAAVGQIDWNLRNAIAGDLPEIAPSYFIVDVQPDQLEPLVASLSARPSVSKIESAPMLRGVITKINDKPAMEVAPDHWVVRGDRGVTYADALPAGTDITAGKWWGEGYEGDPQISFAAEEAEELGLKLGDTLNVNVLGRDITATITSFREVNFSTGGLGFVLSMNAAALRGAPHTHIATIYAEEADEGAILRDMAKTYPNITAIRVRDAIDRVSEVLQGIAAAITYGALSTLVTGGIVLIGTAAAGEKARVYEGAVLKTLGASRAAVLGNFALRSALLGLTAGGIALVTGITAGWGVMVFVMESDFTVAIGSALTIIAGGVLATLVTGLMFAWRPLATRPAQVLRASE